MQMPVLDGFSAAKAILASESTKDHPMIVALTANSSEYHREQSAASGFVAFLSKPLVRVPCLQQLSYRRSSDNRSDFSQNMTEFKAVLADVSRKKRARIEAPDDSDDGAEAVMKGEKDD
jgi:DNA-binding response OmpR family regulator